MTRLDCVLGSAGQMRAALSQASFYAAHRHAFGGPLAAQPAMQQVLADLAVESWAATATAMRLATLVERSIGGDQQATALLRIALPVAKFWVCKRATPMIAEALECLGGNGYVETYPMARLLRESPLNGIWEGSGTVTALDSLRALHRSPNPVRRCWTNSGPQPAPLPTTTMRYGSWPNCSTSRWNPPRPAGSPHWPHGHWQARC